ncbi:MAG TPA: redox-regulated ATPase YchF [bacterium]|nr:redox-regulated ATPase YchF [bacterium]
MKIGIVGLPNVGKSTLFNALTKTYAAEAANFPFCTIDPNVGRVNVEDPRLNELSRIAKTEKTIPSATEFVDIAGLVAGASKGEGRGNAFLANIRECDAIMQVVRIFDDPNVHHVDGSVDPKRDIETINTELVLADLQSLDRKLGEVEKKARGNDTDAKKRLPVYQSVRSALDEGRLARSVELSEEEALLLRDLHLLTMKPFLYACNVNEDRTDMPESELRTAIGIHDQKIPVVAISVKFELDMMGFSPEERAEYLAELGITGNPTETLIRTAFDTLGLAYYFTAGEKEVRAWTIEKGWKAPQAAGVIHTDFEKKFIKAEVVSATDFIAHGGWSGAREAGKVRLEGKDYVVADGDVMIFKF